MAWSNPWRVNFQSSINLAYGLGQVSWCVHSFSDTKRYKGREGHEWGHEKLCFLNAVECVFRESLFITSVCL